MGDRYLEHKTYPISIAIDNSIVPDLMDIIATRTPGWSGRQLRKLVSSIVTDAESGLRGWHQVAQTDGRALRLGILSKDLVLRVLERQFDWGGTEQLPDHASP